MKNKFVYLVILVLVLLSGIFFYTRGEGFTVFSNEQYLSKEENLQLQNNDEPYVYETDAENADDCSKYEKYDPEKKVCYFECESETECRQIQDDIDTELASWLDDNKNDKNFQESDADIEKTITAEYKISQGEQASLIRGKSSAYDNTIWQHISRVSPDSLSNTYIEKFTIFNDPNSDTLAFVDDDDGNGKWRVAVNLDGYKNSSIKERNLTIIHELGHIITLNNSQVKNTSEDSCKNYFTSEGCATATSYLNNFVKSFWNMNDVKKSREGGDVYSSDKFVTEYAASEPEEDLAESFAYFVLDNKNEGTKTKDKKSAFFYSYPELVQIRESMRQAVASDAIRARKASI